ncbi:bifunctional DNA primase/polymerase [Corynebacterium mustelae]|nr:bifunctional DNA primase/polymerase [Corynebacterium mustelae]
MKRACQQCRNEFEAEGSRGRTPKFCSSACKQRAYRHRKAATRRLPELLTQRASWARAKGKRPVQPNGMPASSTDASTWANFQDVTRGEGDGFGVMLGGGLGCLDLDNCFQGSRLTRWARKAIEKLPFEVVFAERSMSGRGLHVFVKAPEMPGRKRGGVEFYSRARFIRVTGDAFSI